jgi:hypothetical protein
VAIISSCADCNLTEQHDDGKIKCSEDGGSGDTCGKDGGGKDNGAEISEDFLSDGEGLPHGFPD